MAKNDWKRKYKARHREWNFWNSSRGVTMRGDIQRAAQRRLDARNAARARTERMTTLRNVFGAWRSQVTPRSSRISYRSEFGHRPPGSKGWLSNLYKK